MKRRRRVSRRRRCWSTASRPFCHATSPATGAAAALVARGAQWNPSVFRPEGFLPQAQVRQDYVRYSRDTENHVANTKYVLREMMKAPKWFKGSGGKGLLESEEGRGLSKCTTMGDLCRLYGVPEVKSTLVAGARVCEEGGREGCPHLPPRPLF